MILNLLICFMAMANESWVADVYDIDGKTKLFKYEGKRTLNAEVLTFAAKFTDLQGQVVATEKAEINKNVIVRYDVERIPTQEKGTIETKDGKIIFSYTEKGKTSTSKDNLKEDTLISASLVPFVESHFNDLVAKKDLPFRYAVWFRKEVIGFKFVLDTDNGKQVVAKMHPTNLLYRSMVNPIYFTFDKATKKLLSIKGRTLPKINKDGAWKDLDALVQYGK